MPKKQNTLVNDILDLLMEMSREAIEFVPRPFETPYAHIRRLRNTHLKNYRDTIYSLQRRGVITISKRNNRRFIQLTRKGQLEALLSKTQPEKHKDWDGKWRVVVFDIPEGSHKKRDVLRDLLKRQGFWKLQGSVFVNPYPLNREAIEYLKKTKLQEFIRIMRVDEMDNDKDLKKKFNL